MKFFVPQTPVLIPILVNFRGNKFLAGKEKGSEPFWGGFTSSWKNWRILQLHRSKIGTANVLQCQVPVWGDLTIGPRTAENGDDYCWRWRGTWEGVTMATWCCGWICRIGGGLVHHMVITPPTASYRCGVQQYVVHQQYFQLTGFVPDSPVFSILQFFQPLD